MQALHKPTPHVEHAGSVLVKWLGRAGYEPTFHAMQEFTSQRDESTQDEIWFLEHDPVFTLGMNGKPEHVLNAGDIPVIPVDRGGQVTYHGPGQLVVYPLLNLRRHKLGVRDLVVGLENAVINLVAQWNIRACGRRDAPGVYVDEKKLASVGLRIRRGCSYHGMALNVAMDLSPFSRINPCGYKNLQVTDLVSLGVNTSPELLMPQFVATLRDALGMQE